MLKWIDKILLHCAEKVCDVWEAYTGKTKYKLDINLRIGFCILVWIITSYAPTKYIFFSFSLAVFHTTITVLTVLMIKKDENEFIKHNTPRLSFGHYFFVRLVTILIVTALLLAPPNIIKVFTINLTGGLLCLLVSVNILGIVYVDAVLPKPPQKSKFRKWYEKGLWWLADVISPPPKHAPIPHDN